VLKNLPEHIAPVVHRLKNTDDFLKLVDYIRDNQWYLADLACKTQGVLSDEYSGAYRVLQDLLSQLTLDEHTAPSVHGRHFE